MSFRKVASWSVAFLGSAAAIYFVAKSDGFLLWSVRHDCIHLALLSLKAGADPNTRRDSQTVLMEAARKSQTSVVAALLLCGANVDDVDDDQRRALHYAAMNAQNDGSVVRLLLEHGANPVAASKHGVTPLILAASQMSGSTSMNAIVMIAYANSVNQQDDDGNTALWVATTEAKIEVLRALLRAGADPNLANHKGGLPITIAASNGLIDRVQLLLEFGADPFLRVQDLPSASEIVNGTAPNHELKTKFDEIAQLINSSRRSLHR